MPPNDSFTRKRDSKCRQLGIGDLDDTKSAPHRRTAKKSATATSTPTAKLCGGSRAQCGQKRCVKMMVLNLSVLPQSKDAP